MMNSGARRCCDASSSRRSTAGSSSAVPCSMSRQRCVQVMAFTRNQKRLKYSALGQPRNNNEPLIIHVQADGSDAWRLEPAAQLLRNGGVGIIPTDTLPALVADLENRDAVLKLYQAKNLDPKKPLSILCKSFQQISHYTTGFPNPTRPGQPNWFNVCRKLLPGPYTLILSASKNLPSQCIDFMSGKNMHRKSVGIRMPGSNPVAQAFLEAADCALLATSVHVPEVLAPDTEVPDVGSLSEAYTGVDFIIDIGPHVAQQSTVVDMTGAVPEVIRYGRGDATVFEEDSV